MAGLGGGACLRGGGIGRWEGLRPRPVSPGLVHSGLPVSASGPLPGHDHRRCGVISSGSASSRLLAFDTGVQFHPGWLKSRAVPDVAALAGFGNAWTEGEVAVQPGTQVQRVRFDESSTKFGAGGGFGVRIYGGNRWGVRPELCLVPFFTEGNGLTMIRFTIGLFLHSVR